MLILSYGSKKLLISSFKILKKLILSFPILIAHPNLWLSKKLRTLSSMVHLERISDITAKFRFNYQNIHVLMQILIHIFI